MTLPEIIAEARRLQRKPEPRPDFTVFIVTHADEILDAAEKSIQLRAEIEAIREAVGQKGCDSKPLILFIKSKIRRAEAMESFPRRCDEKEKAGEDEAVAGGSTRRSSRG